MSETQKKAKPLMIGWANADITPGKPVQLAGQHYARVSEGVLDPVTATALAVSAGDGESERAIFITCDLVSISDNLRDAVRKRIAAELPELAPSSIVLNATHTHTAPLARTESDEKKRMGASIIRDEIKLPVMDAGEYIEWASERIAGAAVSAWRERSAGSIGYALGHAVVGRNRRSVYGKGESRMYGNTSADDFTHIEGYEDHSVNVLATWNAEEKLTGVVVNVP